MGVSKAVLSLIFVVTWIELLLALQRDVNLSIERHQRIAGRFDLCPDQ
jgi:hypothetical protein